MKILASDFDNTLYFYDGNQDYYHLNDIDAIKEFQKAGNLFGLCTGRNYLGITNYNYHNIDYDFYILCSGAKILDKKGQVIFQKMIDNQLVKQILNDYPDIDSNVVLAGKMYFLNHQSPLNKNHQVIDSIDDIDSDFEAFSMHLQDSKTAAKVYQELINKYHDVIALYQNERHLDFAPLGCSKGNGILKIIDYYKIDKNDMAVIGDSYNDLPMFAVVNQAFTFNRSPNEVKKQADYLVDGIDECIEILMGLEDERKVF